MPRWAASGVELSIEAWTCGMGTAGPTGAAGSGLEQAARTLRAIGRANEERLGDMVCRMKVVGAKGRRAVMRLQVGGDWFLPVGLSSKPRLSREKHCQEEWSQMRVYYDRDADVNLIKGKKVLVVGYGSQGHAHAMNLRDSGVKDVRIALKPGSATIKKAEGAGFTVMSPADGAKWADIVMVLTPDELQSDIYTADLAPNMRPGSALAFAHGLNVHFNLITPRADIDVFMIATKGPGHTVRSEYLRGGGVPCLVAVAQNSSGNALEIGLSYSSAIGGGRAGTIETT